MMVVFGLYACDQPTTNLNKQSQEAPQLTHKNGQSIEGQYIIVFKEKDAKGKALASDIKAVKGLRSSVLSDYNIETASVVSEYNVALKGFTAKLDDAKLADLRNDDRINYIEEDRFVTLAPPGACSPWPSCRNDDDNGGGGQTTPWGITRIGGPTSSNGTAWVIDTGIDLDHPDLNVDTQRSAEFVSGGPGTTLSL